MCSSLDEHDELHVFGGSQDVGTEVGDLRGEVAINEDVGRLYIIVEDQR